MGIEDPTPNPATADPFTPESPAVSRPAAPAWADESTIAVPLSELFADDPAE